MKAPSGSSPLVHPDPPRSAEGRAERPLSRRGFLGTLGGATAFAAAGGLTFEALLDAPAAAAEELGPLQGNDRLNAAYQGRLDAADRLLADGIPVQLCNEDETDLAGFVGNFSKGFEHNAIGEVDPVAYQQFRDALDSGNPADFDTLPLVGARPLVNPQAGLAFDTEGNDPHQFTQPAAPKFASAEAAAEMVELYWMALLRDLPFDSYDHHPLVGRAVSELNSLSDFRGPRIGGQVTRQTLFRDDLPGALDGPYLSQFMLKPTPFGAEYVERRMRTLRPRSDRVTDFDEWLQVQRGDVPDGESFDPIRRYIRNGRDLSQWVHVDVLFQAYFNACLILLTPPDPTDLLIGGGIGAPFGPGNPYNGNPTQEGFGTWGGPALKTVLCEVATRALKAVWFQKWFVHRRLRPEAFGGRIHVHKRGLASYPIHPDVLGSEAVDRVFHDHRTYLLPQVFPEGSPMHPSYGAGHGTVAGACVTVLKAFFDESFVIPNAVVTGLGGLHLRRYHGGPLTVGGELNKLASNVSTGRNIAGVHYRTDGIESLRLGEEIAIKVLTDHAATFNEGGQFVFTRFDGTPAVI